MTHLAGITSVRDSVARNDATIERMIALIGCSSAGSASSFHRDLSKWARSSIIVKMSVRRIAENLGFTIEIRGDVFTSSLRCGQSLRKRK